MISCHSLPSPLRPSSAPRRVTTAAYRRPPPPLEVPTDFRKNRRGVVQVAGNYVYRGEGSVKGVCHFVGGAFGGAVPHVIYPLLLPSLARCGYTVVATPFDVTFRHSRCAALLQTRFQETLDVMRDQGMTESVPAEVPVHGIGHSFGALAHALMSCDASHVESNVLISFNNKAVEEAIPIPNFLTVVSTAFRLPVPIVDPTPAVKLVAKEVLRSTGITPRTVDDALDQLKLVFEEIRDGVVDFDPTPASSAEFISERYCVPKTLLVQFVDDTIDETPVLRRLLEGKEITWRRVRGNHLTPCVANLRQVVDDDLVEALQAPALVENDLLVQILVDWLDTNS